MDGPASISSLPAEMHIAIAELVDDKSFHNLRLASHNFARNSIDVFAKRFFKTCNHLYTTQSLIALRDISLRPVFARHIENVNFFVVGVEESVDEMWGIETDVDRPNTKASREEYHSEEHMQAAFVWYQREKDNLHRHHIKLLIDIFRNLNKLGVAKNVKIGTSLWKERLIEYDDEDTDDDFSDEDAFNARVDALISLPKTPGVGFTHEDTWKAHGGVHGVSNLLKKIWPWASRADLRDGDIDLAANALLIALAETRHQVKTLDLAYKSGNKLSEPSTNWNNRSPQAKNLVDVFSTIERLHIGVEGQNAFSSMRPLLTAAANLAAISFDLVDSAHFDDLPVLPNWKHLSMLYLYGPKSQTGRVKRLVEQAQHEEYEVVGVRYLPPHREYVLGRASEIPPWLKGRRFLLQN